METQTLINVAILIAGTGIGLLLNPIRAAITELQVNRKELVSSISELTIKVQNVELLVVDKYVKHSEFEKVIDKLSVAIFAKLDKIDAKLDNKADK